MRHLLSIVSVIHKDWRINPFHSSHQRTQRGFTLIELIVSIGIMLVILGGGIAGYLSLNERQTLSAAGEELQQYMRSAQKKARVGDKPSGCDQLQSYSVKSVGASPVTIELRAICSNNSYVVDSFNLPNSVSLANSIDMRFAVLYGGVTNAQDITLRTGNRKYVFSVNAGGDIGAGVVSNGP